MLKRFFLTLALVVFAHAAFAATTTIRLTLTVAPGAKIPADHYRVKEQIGDSWGDPAGSSGPFIVNAPAATIDVPTTSVSPKLQVIPIANGKEGVPSNTCTTVTAGSDEVVVIVCKPTN